MVKKKSYTTAGKVWRLALCVAVPLLVGGLSALLTSSAMMKFGELNQPFLAPPAWLFPVAWTILYILMGLASYYIFMGGERGSKRDKEISRSALVVYGIQLALNFAWSLIFFNLRWYWPALVWLVVMWAMIVILIVKAHKVSKPAMWMLIPYILWATFASYLNLMIAILN